MLPILRVEIVPFLLVTCVVFPIPLLAVFKIGAGFLESRIPSITDPKRIVAIVLDILISGLVLATLAIHLLKHASGTGYFSLQSGLSGAVFAASVVFNTLSVASLMACLERRDEAYQEYLEFRRDGQQRDGTLLNALRRPGIRKRLALTFLPFILAIIVVPAVVLLGDFRQTTLSAAIAGGESLAEQAALAVGGSIRDEAAVDEYFALQARRNAGAGVPFQAMLFARRNDRTGAYEVTAGTDRSRIGTRAGRAGIPLDRTSWRLSAGGTTYEFTAPVTRLYNLVGYVAVEYPRETIAGPCFRITVKIVLIAAVSVYAALVLLYLFGRNLVRPILYLRMSVNAISRALDGMVKGKARVTPDSLQYKDRVRTKDEVKLLSNEIRGMTGVIRGILPYVSTSTLKHADRERPKTGHGSNKNLAFLFTDIRGFSSLCEEQPPDEVVKMLNHYLGTQADIISTNGGDIDKFVGDEIVAMFDGPKKELHACRASVEIRSAMARERELAELASRNVVSIGIGINTGPVVFGSIGAGDRMDFTSIGDTVNLAARAGKSQQELPAPVPWSRRRSTTRSAASTSAGRSTCSPSRASASPCASSSCCRIAARPPTGTTRSSASSRRASPLDPREEVEPGRAGVRLPQGKVPGRDQRDLPSAHRPVQAPGAAAHVERCLRPVADVSEAAPGRPRGHAPGAQAGPSPADVISFQPRLRHSASTCVSSAMRMPRASSSATTDDFRAKTMSREPSQAGLLRPRFVPGPFRAVHATGPQAVQLFHQYLRPPVGGDRVVLDDELRAREQALDVSAPQPAHDRHGTPGEHGGDDGHEYRGEGHLEHQHGDQPPVTPTGVSSRSRRRSSSRACRWCTPWLPPDPPAPSTVSATSADARSPAPARWLP